MKPKVSIIMPIYNVEDYLSRCLDSLLAQSLASIEIIAVNDGSTDNSGSILSDYASRDSRIIVIEKINGGVSAARNDGILASNGEYIGFVDPDDWVETNMYEEMYTTAIQERADIVMCGYTREFGTHAKIKDFQLPEKVIYCNEEVQTRIMRRLVGPIHEEVAHPELLDAWGTVWSKLYRSEMIKSNQITFTDLTIIGTNEDSLFNIHASYQAQSFIFLNKPYYHYWRANTTSVTFGYKPDLHTKWFTLYGLVGSYLKEKRMTPEFFSALNNRICLNTLGLGLNMISKSNQASGRQKVSSLRHILNDNRIRHSFVQLEMKHFSLIWKMFYYCAKFRFTLTFYFMLIAIDVLRKMVR